MESIKAFDVVIPAHEKDLDILNHCIAAIKKNVPDVRRIIVASKTKLTDRAEWFDESLFPFSYQEVSELIKSNVGWNFQQLLKLYSAIVIPDILPDVLVVDADTVFLRKINFFEDGLPLYNLSKDKNLHRSVFYQATLNHIKSLLPEIEEKLPELFSKKPVCEISKKLTERVTLSSEASKKQLSGLVSGICHHMMLQRSVIEDLFLKVEKHDGSGDPFYKIFLKKCENSYSAAEYNLYFYFLCSFYPNKFKIRILSYKNTANFNLIKERLRGKYHYCSYHSYMRDTGVGFVKKILNKFLKIFYYEQWNIGILHFPIQDILNKEAKICWLPTPKGTSFHADPFGFDIAGKKFIIFEDYSKFLKRGRIAIAEFNTSSQPLKSRIVLDDKRHLSYPFVINVGNEICVICESCKSKKLIIYRIDKATLQLEKMHEIFSNQAVVDPTILHYKNKFWIFYTTNEGENSNLHIAFSDSLFGEFKQHPKNPVKINPTSSRSAGTIFKIGEEIYRPAQNCSKTYGGSIVINRILELSEESFYEEVVKEIMPNPHDTYNFGLHTISNFGSLTLVDGKRKHFVIYKPVISLLANLRKILLVN